jgi:large subunit ribosomal protein L10
MPMNRAKKASELQEVKTMIGGEIEALVAVENKGLSVKQVEELRRGAKADNAIYKVSKNALTKIALKGTKFEGMTDLFKGPTALIISRDILAAARVAQKFASSSNDKLVVLGGSNGDKVFNAKDIKYYASLPSLDALRGKLVGLLQAPAAQLARVVNAYATKDGASA